MSLNFIGLNIGVGVCVGTCEQGLKERLHIVFFTAFLVVLNAAFACGLMKALKTKHLTQGMGSGSILCVFHRRSAKQ